MVENYNPAYLLTSPVLDAVCYETIEGVPDEITVEIYATFCDRDIQRMIKAAEFKKGDGTLRNFVAKIVKKFRNVAKRIVLQGRSPCGNAD